MNRKIISFILLVTLIFTFTACNNNAKVDNPSQNEQSVGSEKTETEDTDNQSQNSETSEDEDLQLDSPESDESSLDNEQSSGDEVEEDNSEKQDQEEIPEETISLSVEGPEDDIIYSNDNYELTNNSMTALEILQKLQKNEIIRFEYQGSGSTAYLKGIDNYYEFDFGPLSGWMIEKNGEFPLKSIGKLKVNPGDSIRFIYTKELGEDLTN